MTISLLAVVLGATAPVLLRQERLYRELGQRADLSDNLRAAAGILAADLWALDAADGDLLALGPDSIRIRAERAVSVVCDVSGGAIVLRRDLTYGVRDLASGDSLLVMGDPDSAWGVMEVGGAPSAGICPDSQPGERIAVTGSLPGAGAPVRVFEDVTYRSYRASDGFYYLGLRDAGGLQPVAGPVTPGGLALSFVDSGGAATVVPRRVAAIRIRVRMQSAEPVSRRGVSAPLTDSAVVWVTLRNNPGA